MANQEALIRKIADQMKLIDALKKDHDQLEKATLEIEKRAKAMQHPAFKLTGYVAAYMKAIKESDGLISALPSCLKAIQNAEKSATVDTIGLAIKAVAEQQKAALKVAGTDSTKKRQAADFNKDLDKLSARLEDLL